MVNNERRGTIKCWNENIHKMKSMQTITGHLKPQLTVNEILEAIISSYNSTLWKIQSSHSGVKNMPRLVAIYCLRFLRGLTVKSIARVVRSPSGNTIAQILYRSRAKIRKDPIAQEIIADLCRHGREKKFKVARSNGQCSALPACR